MTTITITDVVSSVVSIQFGDIELTRWSDGSITLEELAYVFGADDAEHCCLSADQARALDDLLSEV